MKRDGHKILPVLTFFFRLSYMIICDQNGMFVSFKSHLNTVALSANSVGLKNNFFKFLWL